MFHSAWDNYLNFGSDTGGYRGGNHTKEVFLRWSQVSTFTPLFENGGEGTHAPWLFDEATVVIYRKLVIIHEELAPYFQSWAVKRYESVESMMKPMASYTVLTPDSWNYLMGPDIFVCPIVASINISGTRTVDFPKGDDWINWWTNTSYAGGSSHTFSLDPDFSTFPVFRRAGSIIPMEVVSDYSENGDFSSRDALTFLFTSVRSFESVEVFEWENSGGLVANYTLHEHFLDVQVTAWDSPVILLFRNLPASPSSINDLLAQTEIQQTR